jgi:hypothetical protein
MDESYPLTYSVDYPDRDLNRLTTFFRIFTVIPIYIVFVLLVGIYWGSGEGGTAYAYAGAGIGLLTLPTLLMLLFRKKYPRWWYDWNLELSRFSNRVTAYALLMDDRYPSTDDHQSVDLQWPQVTGAELSRGLPLVKWFLAIPHYIVLFFLWIALVFVAIYVWFVVLFTGRYPRGAFGFIEGVLRWGNRVAGYAYALVTDVYPPFQLSA